MRAISGRRVATAAAAALLSMTLVSCATTGGTATSTETDGATASDSPTSESPSESSTDVEESPAGDAGDLAEGDTLTAKQLAALLGRGVATYSTVHMTIEGQADGRRAQVEADIDTRKKKSPALRMTMKSAGETVEMILVDDAFYLGDPTSDTPYLKFANPRGVPFGLDKRDATEPGGGFVDDQDLGQATYLGEEDVDGVTAQHFSIEGKGDLKDADLWIDGEGRVIRIASAVDGDSATISFSKFGEKVTIKAPTNVRDLSALGQ